MTGIQKGKQLAAICAAPSVFGDLGILNGKEAVCYPGFEERLTGATIGEGTVAVTDHVITSRGMGNGNICSGTDRTAAG